MCVRAGFFVVCTLTDCVSLQAFEPHVILEDDGKTLAAALTFFPSWEQLDKDLLTPYVEGERAFHTSQV